MNYRMKIVATGQEGAAPLVTAPKAKNVVPTTAGVTAMNTATYDQSITALLVVDPYNDFISEGGKMWPRIKAVAEANDQTVGPMLDAVSDLSLLPSGRLRDVEVRCARTESIVEEQELRIRHVGRRVPQRIRARAGRGRRAGTLVLQQFRQHRPGFAPQEARHPSAHRHRADSAYLHRSDRSLRRRARLRGHCGEGRDSGLFGRDDARRA